MAEKTLEIKIPTNLIAYINYTADELEEEFDIDAVLQQAKE